jgi:hypothetical protein
MKSSVMKRLEDLENQPAQPAKIHFAWYGESSNPDVPHFKLKWLDECRGGLE